MANKKIIHAIKNAIGQSSLGMKPNDNHKFRGGKQGCL